MSVRAVPVLHASATRRKSMRQPATQSPTIVFAGGGSGGHISPGIAIAESLARQGAGAASARTVFLCSTRPIDATMLAEAGMDFHAIPAAPISGHPLKLLRFVREFAKGRKLAQGLLREVDASLVVALGGFVTGPVVAAAKRLNVSVVLLNLDAKPGRANRWIAGRSDLVMTTIETPQHPGFASRKVGFPLRRSAVAGLSRPECRTAAGLAPDIPVLLVTGASQGATSINNLLMHLARQHADLFRGWQVLHLAGAGADQEVRSTYQQLGIRARVEPFVHQMANAWGAADLAISRAGANSVAEAAANGVPTIFLPYPYHRDLHQKWNAQPLADSGGAVIVIDQIDAAANARAVLPLLRRLMNDSAALGSMSQALQRLAQPNAADEIANLLLARLTCSES